MASRVHNDHTVASTAHSLRRSICLPPTCTLLLHETSSKPPKPCCRPRSSQRRRRWRWRTWTMTAPWPPRCSSRGSSSTARARLCCRSAPSLPLRLLPSTHAESTRCRRVPTGSSDPAPAHFSIAFINSLTTLLPRPDCCFSLLSTSQPSPTTVSCSRDKRTVKQQSRYAHLRFHLTCSFARADAGFQAVERGQQDVAAAVCRVLLPAGPLWQRGALEVGIPQPPQPAGAQTCR